MERVLGSEPELPEVKGLRVRTFHDATDINAWLSIRHKAFARQRLGVLAWSAADFRREFLTKPWWRPEHMWFAEAFGQISRADVAPLSFWWGEPVAMPQENIVEQPMPAEGFPIGTVTLALRGEGASATPVVHWLAVLPAWRRQGVGRLLLAHLERRAWQLGYRRVALETHAAWTAAVHLYEQAGYRAAER